MSKLYYPAVFHVSEDVGGYWVEFPDLPGCFSQGNDIDDTMEFAKEALGLYLDKNDDLYERTISKPSAIHEVMKQFPMKLLSSWNIITLNMNANIKVKLLRKH